MNHPIRWRCVAVRNADFGHWHRYVTNTPPAMMKAEHFTAVYAARWEVELLFRELKCTYRIEQMPRANQHVTGALIYTGLLTLVLSRRLYRLLTKRWRLPPRRLPFGRWAILLATVAHDLFGVALSRRDRAYGQRRIERLLRAEALDPNRSRMQLAHRAQLGIYAPAQPITDDHPYCEIAAPDGAARRAGRAGICTSMRGASSGSREGAYSVPMPLYRALTLITLVLIAPPVLARQTIRPTDRQIR
jgi:hypothetical protein